MSSQIDVTKPTTGTATTQSVRDNFTSMVSEIEALQGEVSIHSVAASVASNALTASLKTSAGIDATSSTGVEVTFRNATAATGTRTSISIVSAIAVVVPQGATMGFANSETDYLYLYVLNNAGTVEIAISSSLFDENTLQSTTQISANADSKTVLYSSTARNNVAVRFVGRIKVATGATAGDWSAAPTELSSSQNFHNIIGQDVQAYDADTAKTDVVQTYTASQIGEVTALTDASSIATDLALSNNFSVTLAGNRTLANPTNTVAGQSGSIFITQDGTGSRTLAFGTNFKFVAGTAPTLSTAASSIDRIDYVVAEATKIHAVASLDVK